MPFEATLGAFARAVVDADEPTPPQTRGRAGTPDRKRFSVYRNNVAVGLTSALEARFPVTRRLVGDDFFRAMASAYVLREKPLDAVLIRYGGGFPDFVATFEPAKDIPYLSDVARLENAWVEAYHAAEASPLTLSELAGVSPEALGDLRLVAHPALRLLRSPHPAASIWAAHQGDGEVAPPSVWSAEDAMIVRPDAEVSVRVLPPGGYEFALSLSNGETIGEAAAKASVEGFDPGAHLVGLIEAGAIAAIVT